ncbi:hypothetical protein T01_15234 [Trichinella spiralis]|uniref:Uncharacterized protein n=1 Tax=Trichinella spiralis TaxID=6334 RepID=A0A0V1BUS6_TRISP|nr:hypothetical protein T01_15234 [Trichinella spiralis]
MPSGKRETERKGNAPVNTGPSPNSDGRANNTVEEVNELVQGSDSLQLFCEIFEKIGEQLWLAGDACYIPESTEEYQQKLS